MPDAVASSGNGVDTIVDAVKSSLNKATPSLADVERQAQSFVRQRPFAAVLVAVAAGYCLARVARRF